MSVRFVDNFHAALTVGIDSVETEISFAAGTGDIFRDKLGSPLSTDHIYGTLFNAGGDIEIVKITATADDDFTIVRAQGVTTARAWLAGDVLSCRPCAPALSEAISLPTDLARSGINIDITELRALGVPLSIPQGGTGATTAATARTSLGAAASGANTDITSLNSPALGAATATTAISSDSSTKVATTAFVNALLDTKPEIVAAFLFNGNLTGTNAPTKGYNVTSVTRNGTGVYTVNMASALADTNYVVVVAAYDTGLPMAGNGNTRTTTTIGVNTFIYNSGSANDCDLVQGVVYALP